MIAFRHILCATDFSDTAARALAHATALATRYDARLTLLHVVPVFEESLPAGLTVGRASAGWLRDEVLGVMHRAVAQTGAAAIDPALLVEEGRPDAVIVAQAAALPADLLVLGTHGRGGFTRLMLGSVAEKVVRTAACPVLTIPPAAASSTAAAVAFRQILCPIDYSPASLRALEYALELGRQGGGRVTVLSALEYMDVETPAAHVDAGIRRNRDRFIEDARQRLHRQLTGEPETRCEVEEVVAVNRAYKAILQHASASGTDLIVMGAQGADGIELMLYGSNTHHVVRAATCPVLTVRA